MSIATAPQRKLHLLVSISCCERIALGAESTVEKEINWTQSGVVIASESSSEVLVLEHVTNAADRSIREIGQHCLNAHRSIDGIAGRWADPGPHNVVVLSPERSQAQVFKHLPAYQKGLGRNIVWGAHTISL